MSCGQCTATPREHVTGWVGQCVDMQMHRHVVGCTPTSEGLKGGAIWGGAAQQRWAAGDAMQSGRRDSMWQAATD